MLNHNRESEYNELSWTNICRFQKETQHLPLEIQEQVIVSGPKDDPDRLSFLCKCALVCKNWVPTSRSSLALRVKRSRRDWLSFTTLVKSPYMTLAYATQAVRVYGDDDLTDHDLISATLPHLLSVSSISFSDIFLSDFPTMMFMPNVKVLKLKQLTFPSADVLPKIMACFPHLVHLEVGDLYCQDTRTGCAFLDIVWNSAKTIHTLDISIYYDEDMQILGPFVASSSLQRLTLRLCALSCTHSTARWLAKHLPDIHSHVFLSVMVTNEPLDMYPTGVFTFMHMPFSHSYS